MLKVSVLPCLGKGFAVSCSIRCDEVGDIIASDAIEVGI